MKKIILAGGSGFLGRVLAAHFLSSGQAVTILTRAMDWNVEASFSENGNGVLTASGDGFATLWDLNGRKVKEFDVGPHEDIELSQNGQLLVTIVGDGRVRVWNSSGQRLGTIEGAKVVISPDSRFMAITRIWDGGTQTQVWPISIAGYLSRLDSLQIPCLTPAQLREGLLLDEAATRAELERCTTNEARTRGTP